MAWKKIKKEVEKVVLHNRREPEELSREIREGLKKRQDMHTVAKNYSRPSDLQGVLDNNTLDPESKKIIETEMQHLEAEIKAHQEHIKAKKAVLTLFKKGMKGK